jgi:hypothetical protein
MHVPSVQDIDREAASMRWDVLVIACMAIWGRHPASPGGCTSVSMPGNREIAGRAFKACSGQQPSFGACGLQLAGCGLGLDPGLDEVSLRRFADCFTRGRRMRAKDMHLAIPDLHLLAGRLDVGAAAGVRIGRDIGAMGSQPSARRCRRYELHQGSGYGQNEEYPYDSLRITLI